MSIFKWIKILPHVYIHTLFVYIPSVELETETEKPETRFFHLIFHFYLIFFVVVVCVSLLILMISFLMKINNCLFIDSLFEELFLDQGGKNMDFNAMFSYFNIFYLFEIHKHRESHIVPAGPELMKYVLTFTDFHWQTLRMLGIKCLITGR